MHVLQDITPGGAPQPPTALGDIQVPLAQVPSLSYFVSLNVVVGDLEAGDPSSSELDTTSGSSTLSDGERR